MSRSHNSNQAKIHCSSRHPSIYWGEIFSLEAFQSNSEKLKGMNVRSVSKNRVKQQQNGYSEPLCVLFRPFELPKETNLDGAVSLIVLSV